MRILRILAMLMVVCITTLSLGAQEEVIELPTLPPPPSYATSLDLSAEPMNDVTVRLLWAAADEKYLQVAWEVQMNPDNFDSFIPSATMVAYNASGSALQPMLSNVFPSEAITFGSAYQYISVFENSYWRDEIGRLQMLTAVVNLNVLLSQQDFSKVRVVPIAFDLSIPLIAGAKWAGEQTVEVTSYPMTLRAVRYAVSMTEMDVCLPMIPTAQGGGDFYLPYMMDETFRPNIIYESIYYLASDGQPSAEISPESTPEPMGLATLESADTVCMTMGLVGFPQPTDGLFRVSVDELRSRGNPTPESALMISAAMQAAGQGGVAWDEQNGLGFGGPNLGRPMTYREAQYHGYKMGRVISDVTSERILGPWVFEVTLE